jgi:hypothetical protein
MRHFVCGPVLFTGTAGRGLSDAALARVIDAHAAADQTIQDTSDPAGVDVDFSWDQ